MLGNSQALALHRRYFFTSLPLPSIHIRHCFNYHSPSRNSLVPRTIRPGPSQSNPTLHQPTYSEHQPSYTHTTYTIANDPTTTINTSYSPSLRKAFHTTKPLSPDPTSRYQQARFGGYTLLPPTYYCVPATTSPRPPIRPPTARPKDSWSISK